VELGLGNKGPIRPRVGINCKSVNKGYPYFINKFQVWFSTSLQMVLNTMVVLIIGVFNSTMRYSEFHVAYSK
jgi:hypothetical protein